MNVFANIQQSLGANMASNDESVVVRDNLGGLEDNKCTVNDYLKNKEQVDAIRIGQEETKEPSRSRQRVYSADDSQSSHLLNDCY